MTRTEPPFRRVLIANRGEIAVRIIRACRELGMEAVAVYSDADANAAHVRHGRRRGPPRTGAAQRELPAHRRRRGRGRRVGRRGRPSGLRVPRGTRGVRARRRGRGPRLSSDPRRRPSTRSETSSTPGGSRRRVDVPAVPGTLDPAPVDRPDQVAAIAPRPRASAIPLLVKAAAGGGGRGMRRVERAAELPQALASGSREAAAAFGDGSVYLEREILPARHVEVQLLADAHGTVVALGERDCSLQRRHQKLVEEAPAPGLSATAATRAARDGHASRRSGRPSQRGDLRVPPRSGRALLVPRGQHAAPGGARRDGARRGRRHRARAVPRRGRAAAGRRRPRGRRTRVATRRATRSRCASPPRIRRGRSRRRRVASGGG